MKIIIHLSKLQKMALQKVRLTIAEQINRARAAEGRTQKWIIQKLNEAGFPFDDVSFSNKKNGVTFSKEELQALSQILGTEITAE